MNHQSLIAFESNLAYRRRSYVLGQLDKVHFAALNPGNQVSMLCGYCLDALDDIPAGGMHNRYAHIGGGMNFMPPRGMTVAEYEEENAAIAALIDTLSDER